MTEIAACFRGWERWSSLHSSREKLLMLLSLLGVPLYWGTCAKGTLTMRNAPVPAMKTWLYASDGEAYYGAIKSPLPAPSIQQGSERLWNRAEISAEAEILEKKGEMGPDGPCAGFAGLLASQPFACQAGEVLSGCWGPQSHLLNVRIKILPRVTWGAGEAALALYFFIPAKLTIFFLFRGCL